MARRRFLLLFGILLGACGGILWHLYAMKDVIHQPRKEYPRFTRISDLDLEKEIEIDLNLCNENFGNKAAQKNYETLNNKLKILQEFIPFLTNYSTQFNNPCWYDFHQKPTSTATECVSVAIHYNPLLVKRALNQVQKSSKRHLYCLPAYFLVGFPICATTTLYKMIARHPLMVDDKCQSNPSHFWSMFMNKHGTYLDKNMQVLHYLNYFSESIETIESNPQSKLIDHSVSSIIWTTWTTAPRTDDSEFCLLPSLLMRVLPEAKFIVIMRNPTERTFSHYYFYSVMRTNEYRDSENIDSGRVYEDFHRDTLEAIVKFQSCVSDGHFVSHCVRKKDIEGENADPDGQVGIQTSLYYYHIVPWLSIIPRERFLFLRTEDLANDPELTMTMTKVWHFLNLSNFPSNERIVENTNRQASGLTIPPRTKELLDDFFRPYNHLLAQLLSDERFQWSD